MKLGIIIYSNDLETVWNAFGLGVYALKERDTVKVYILGKGMDCKLVNTDKFKVKDEICEFKELGGEILGCSTCAEIHPNSCIEAAFLAPTMELHKVIKESDKVVTF